MRPTPEHLPGAPTWSRDIEQCKGILMAVHRVGPDQAWELLVEVSQRHGVEVGPLAAATVELVHGAAPGDIEATLVALRFLMGQAAYDRPVLDGQVHQAVRAAGSPGRQVEKVDALLRAADLRDRAAERRQHEADDRDRAARPDDDQGSRERDERARGQSAVDRAWAARDRDDSAGDRAALVEFLHHHHDLEPDA